MRGAWVWVAVIMEYGCSETATLEEATEIVPCHWVAPLITCHAACVEEPPPENVADHTCIAKNPNGDRHACLPFEWRGLEGCCVASISAEFPTVVFAPCDE